MRPVAALLITAVVSVSAGCSVLDNGTQWDDLPEDTSPSVADGNLPFQVFDPAVMLLLPDGLEWLPFEPADHADFLDSVAGTDFADQVEAVTVGEAVESATGTGAFLAREFLWPEDVDATELASSLDEVYLQGTSDVTELELGGVGGTVFTDDDGSTGWIGHIGRFSVVLQFPDGQDPITWGDSYVGLNYG